MDEKITIEMLKWSFDKYTTVRKFSVTIDGEKFDNITAKFDFGNATLNDVIHHCLRQRLNDFRNMVRQSTFDGIAYMRKQNDEILINVCDAGRRPQLPPTPEQLASTMPAGELRAYIETLKAMFPTDETPTE